MSYSHLTNIWENLAEDLILDQYKESANLKALIKVFVDVGQSFEDACDRMRYFWDVDRAEGSVLDLIGKIRNLPRNVGESDNNYRARIKEDCAIDNAGTPGFVIKKSRIKSGDTNPIYFDENINDPVAFVYTPNGRQLGRAYVNSLTPAGVLGVPGAVLKMGYLSNTPRYRRNIMLGNGKKIIGVARHGYDDGIRTGYVLDNNGNRIVDENGNHITYEEHIF